MNKPMLKVCNVSKTFVLHNQNGIELPVLQDSSLSVEQGECVVLHGHSGSGKSTLLRALYANYLVDSGSIEVCHHDQWVDLVSASPREVLNVRRDTVGWVSQFLRVIPRISALEVVMQPMLEVGGCREEAERKASQLLRRLNVPEHLCTWRRQPSLVVSSNGLTSRGALLSITQSCYLMSQRRHWMRPTALLWSV